MKRLIAKVSLGLLWSLLAGCSSADKESAGMTREQFCQQWAEAACSTEVVSVCQAASVDACRLSQQGFCEDLVPAEFAPDQAGACLSAVKAAYQDADLTSTELLTVLRLGKPCDKLVRGPNKEGESCNSTLDCDAPSGFECVIKGSDTRGTCQKPVAKGAGLSCAAADQICMDGFYCDGSHCVEGKAIGDDCATQQECGTDAYCADDSTCTKRLAVDEVCTADIQCDSGVCYDYGSEKSCLDRLRLSRSEPACSNLR